MTKDQIARFQIITMICVEIDFLWMFDRRVASFFKHLDHESRFLYYGWVKSSTTKPKHGISEQMLFSLWTKCQNIEIL